MSSVAASSSRPRATPLSALRERVKSRVPLPLRRAIRELREEWRIQRLHERSVGAAQRLDTSTPLRLNLASGYRAKPGWINVDLFAPDADLHLDLRRPLPFPEGCVGYIYVEHFFEHLKYPGTTDSNGWTLEDAACPSEALSFLRECFRVLIPGGTLDIVVPDAEMIVTEYVHRHRDGFPAYPWWGPSWCDTPMHVVNYVFRQGHEHQYAYDGETLARLLETTGFTEVARRDFDPEMDAPNHQIGSLCMLARKPGADAHSP